MVANVVFVTQLTVFPAQVNAPVNRRAILAASGERRTPYAVVKSVC